jgi:hypothetical protein
VWKTPGLHALGGLVKVCATLSIGLDPIIRRMVGLVQQNDFRPT